MTATGSLDTLLVVNGGSTAPPGRLDRIVLGVALASQALAWWLSTKPVALDPDPMNLAYGMRVFDITHFNPHAPGYLVYVWTLRAVHALTGGSEALAERFATVQLVALLFALASTAVIYAAARRIKLSPGCAGWAALVMALHPILWFHSVDAQTHTAEAFASALLVFGAIRYKETPGASGAIVLGILLAFGSSLRPSFIVFGIPIIVWTIGFRRFADLAIAGATSIVGAASWIMPTVRASGGWETWRAATRGLVHHGFVLTSSPFSDTAVEPVVWANQLSLGLWTFEALLPLLVALAVAATRTPAGQARFSDTAEGRWLRGALLVGGAFVILYYGATFISEPGYLAALLAPVALYVGALAGGGAGWRPAALAAMVSVACWALPPLPYVLKAPSVPEVVRRTELALAYSEHVSGSLPLPADARYLALVDHPDITVGRQLPMLSSRVDTLLIHDGRRPWIGQSSLTFVTEDDSTPIPEAFGAPGAGANIETSRDYAGLYFDGTLAPHFQAQVAAHSTCPVRVARDVTDAVVLPIECLRDATLVLDDLSIRVAVPGAPAR